MTFAGLFPPFLLWGCGLEYPQFLTPRNDLALDFIGRGRFFGGKK